MAEKRYNVGIYLDLHTGELVRGGKELDRLLLEQVKSTNKAEAHKQKIVELSTRAQYNTIAQAARAVEKVKDREAQAFGRTEAHKQRLVEISTRSQSNAVLQAARAAEKAKDREVQAFARAESHKQRLAEVSARSQAKAYEIELRRIARASQQTAKDSSFSFSSLLGANFFGNLAARAVGSFISELRTLPERAAKLASEAQNAFKGLESVSIFRGIDKDAARDAVQNLRFVQGGIISVAEASTTLKNLLSSGFSLPEAITLVERFSDAAAFGKQAALGYGEAIRGASEGIKNQNSLLVDNVGITKNLSIILKERGFELQDIADRTKGAAARQALYNGLLVESQAQVGDADKVMRGYTGTIAAQDLAYQNLERSLGNIITTHPAIIESSKIVAEQFREQTTEINNSDSAVNDFVESMSTFWAKIKANAMPAIATVSNIVRTVSSSLGVMVTALSGSFLRLFEELANSFLNVGNTIVNGVKVVINGVTSAIQAAGIDKLLNLNLSKLEMGAPSKANFGSEFMFGKTKEALDDVVKSIQKVAAIDEQRAVNALRIDFSILSKRQEQDAQRRADKMSGVDRNAEAQARLQRSQALADSVLSTSAGRVVDTAGTSEKAKKVKKAKEVIDEIDRWSISELKDIQEFFQRATGKALPFRAGQTSLHNRRGWDHRNAADVHLNPSSPEGRLLINYLKANDVPFIPSTGREAWSTGPHIHVGERSRRFGANVRSRRETRRDDMLSVPLPGGQIAQVSQYQIDSALQGLLERQFDKNGRAEGFKYAGAVESTAGNIGGVGKLARKLTSAEQSRRVKDAEYLGEWEETSRGVFERVGGAYEATINRRANLDKEYGDQFADALLERENREMDYVIGIGKAEATLHQMRVENSNAESVANRRKNQVKDEELDLVRRLQRLHDDNATMGANAVLSQQIALQEELNALKKADIDAVESQIRSQARLADAGILHTEQVRASVLDHISQQKTLTESFGDGIISLYDRMNDAIYSGVSRLTGGIKELDGILTSIISQLTNRLFQKFLDVIMPSGNSSSPSFGSRGGGFNLGSIFGSIRKALGFGGGSSSSGAGASAQLNTVGDFEKFFGTGSGVAAPRSASAAATGAGSSFFGGGLGGASTAAGGKLSLGSMASGFAPMLPLLGMSLGASLTGGSRGSSLLGSAGGLLLGGAGMAGILGAGGMASIFGGSVTAPVFGSVGTGLGPAMAGLLTNPFTIAAGGALLVAGIIASRNAARRRAERDRNQLGTDARTQVYDLIARVRSNPQNAIGAMDEYEAIKKEYMDNARSTIKDRKTLDHAIKWWSDMDRDVKPLLQREISKAQGYLATSPLLHGTYDVSRYSLGLSNSSIPSAAGGGLSSASLSSLTSIPRPSFPSIGGGSTTVGTSNGSQIAPPPMNVSVSIDREGMAQVIVDHPLFKQKAVAAVRASISDNPAGIPLDLKAANQKFLGG